MGLASAVVMVQAAAAQETEPTTEGGIPGSTLENEAPPVTIDPAEPNTLDALIVTGERTARTVRNTASSVAVTTSDAIDRLPGADTLDRALSRTANVTASGPANQGPTIRGSNSSGVLTSLESFFGGSQPRATVQVDGRPLTFNEFVYAGESIWDVERVEVFRGPQTTTQGRNAIAGAIYIETTDPDHTRTSSRVRAIGGDYRTRQGSAVATGPLGDGQLAYRVSADYRKRQSVVEPLGVETDIGADLRTIETVNLRGKLSFQPDALDNVDALLTLTHTDTARPQTEGVDPPFDELERVNPGFSVFETGSSAAVLDMGLALSNTVELSSVTTFADVGVQRKVAPGQGNLELDSTDITQELTLDAESHSGHLSALGGLYLSQLDSDEQLDLSGFDIGIGSFSDRRQSLGVFGEGSWSMTDRLALTVGGRWQQDTQDRDGGFTPDIPIDFDESFDAFLPRAELAYDIDADSRVGAVVERGFNAGGFTFNFDTFEAERFRQETLWNYELFVRSAWLDNQLTINGNLFYNDITDLQVATLVELEPDFVATLFSNAPAARSFGGEMEMNWQASDTLMLGGSAGVTETEYLSDSSAGATLSGNEFQRAPAFTLVAEALWTPTPQFEASVALRHTEGYFSDDANVTVNEIAPLTRVDVRAGYRFANVHVFADVTNLLDEVEPIALFDDASLANVSAPRLASLGIEVEFGAPP